MRTTKPPSFGAASLRLRSCFSSLRVGWCSLSDEKLDEALRRNGVPVEEEQGFSLPDGCYWFVVLVGLFGTFSAVMSFVGAWQ